MNNNGNLFIRLRISIAIITLLAGNLSSQTLQEIEAHRVSLPNGWKLTPVGNMLPLGDLPLNIAVSPSKKYLAVTNNGQSDQSVQLIDAREERILDSVIMAKSWLGLAFSADEKFLYASGGNDNWIVKFAILSDKLVPADTLRIGKPWPVKISPAGIALDDSRHTLYVVTKEDNSLYTLDLNSGKVTGQYPLGGEGYTCLLSPDGQLLYISCWGCNKVILFETGKRQIAGSVPVGDNPNELCITKDGNYLFVANANDNSVSVIDTRKRKVIETLNAALFPASPTGSTTNGLALEEDDKTLYIANADNNCLAVFDVEQPGRSVSKGYIPTGWYPTCVRTSDHKLFISNGKGIILPGKSLWSASQTAMNRKWNTSRGAKKAGSGYNTSEAFSGEPSALCRFPMNRSWPLIHPGSL